MAEYIEREKAYTLAKKICDAVNSGTRMIFLGRDILDWIDDLPAADVRPVVHGEWIGYPECLKYPNAYADDHIVCSACEECFSILDNCTGRFDFCPHCGADMREES